MLKAVISVQTVAILGMFVLGLSLSSDLSNARQEIAGLREAGPSADLRKEVVAIRKKLDDEVLLTLQFMGVDIEGIKKNTWEAYQMLQEKAGNSEPGMPEGYRELFEPETLDALKKAAAEKGVKLLDDRVEVPGVIIQDRAMLEFFAVITGGKEHEAVVALTGSYEHGGERLPEGLAGVLNACILALGYEKGTPVQVSRDGKVLPPQGMPIHVYVEWEADGEKVRARAEDLVYNIERQTSMDRDCWVYVGSRFDRDFGTGETIYLADVTGDVVATYSWPNTIVDNTTSEGQDDIYYRCFTPRIPKVGTKVTMVFSKDPLPAKEFPPWTGETDDGGDDSGK